MAEPLHRHWLFSIFLPVYYCSNREIGNRILSIRNQYWHLVGEMKADTNDGMRSQLLLGFALIQNSRIPIEFSRGFAADGATFPSGSGILEKGKIMKFIFIFRYSTPFICTLPFPFIVFQGAFHIIIPEIASLSSLTTATASSLRRGSRFFIFFNEFRTIFSAVEP